ncbi:MAG: ATP-binding cassette domain-containing protein [Sphingobium sp.]
MSFEIDVRRRIGDRVFHFSLDTGAGLTAISGPSGIGKTSLLNMVAGLLRPDSGHIGVSGTVLFDGATGTDLPVHRRRAGYVFQDARLFPHMRVDANLRYGERIAADGETPLAMGYGEVIRFLGIAHLLRRWPSSLSGGEAQRVAIGRALLSRPRFLLMDEPLGALDPDLRESIIAVIERIRDEIAVPILYVSHDRQEVERLANNLITLA